jgi:hypothetical protein
MKLEFLAAALTLLGFVAAAPEPKVEPWPKQHLTGIVVNEEGFQLFGVGNKRLCIETPQKDYGLAFATQADYEQAERQIGQLVEVEAHAVTRGVETVYVPVVLRARK